MAVERDRPYSQFNFQVVIDGGPAARPLRAAFHEVSGLSVETTGPQDRGGNLPAKKAAKIKGTHKVPDVTLKRGVIGDLGALQNWLNQARAGAGSSSRTVTLQLLNQSHSGIVQEWVLTNARPIKYTGPSLSGEGTDVAIEELVLASESLDVKPRP